MCKRARGISGSQKEEEMQSERDQFQKLSYRKMETLMGKEINPEQEFETLKSYCGECFDELRKVYSAYGALGGGGGSVSFYEFSSLVRDCNLLNPNWTNADLTLVFVKTNIEIDEETGERIEIDHNPDSALTTTEFVEILIRIAHGLYKNKPLQSHEMVDNSGNSNSALSTSARTITQCMSTLMETNILPYAKRSDAEEFRKKLKNGNVKSIFQKYGERIESVFEKYAKADVDQNFTSDGTGNERADMTMNMREFQQMCKEKRIAIPHRKIQSVFQNVQNDDTAFADDDEMDAEVDFSEFQEAVAAIACIVYPDPYTPMEQRIEMLLLRSLLQNEKKKKKKRGRSGSMSKKK
jgi:hypothetical protein